MISKKHKQVVRSKKSKQALEKKIRRIAGFLVLLCLGVAGVSLRPFFNSLLEKEKPKQVQPSTGNSEEQIKKDLQKNLDAYRLKHQIAKDKIMQAVREMPTINEVELDNSILKDSITPADGVDLTQEPLFKELLTVLNEAGLVQDDFLDIEDRVAHYEFIDGRLSVSQRKRNQVQKDEFVQQFVENARKKGYIVELNENLEVTAIAKIQKKSPKFTFPVEEYVEE